MKLFDLLLQRRSVRKYTEEPVTEEHLQQILQAGLISPTSKGRQSREFILVQDKTSLEEMSHCRDKSARMLSGASAAIVVLGDTNVSDVWIEDGSIALSNMHLMANSLGLGSCWIQGRNRDAENGVTTDEYLRELLGYPEYCHVIGILSIGHPVTIPTPHTVSDLSMEKIHRERF